MDRCFEFVDGVVGLVGASRPLSELSGQCVVGGLSAICKFHEPLNEQE
jgi:hypothetical protein